MSPEEVVENVLEVVENLLGGDAARGLQKAEAGRKGSEEPLGQKARPRPRYGGVCAQSARQPHVPVRCVLFTQGSRVGQKVRVWKAVLRNPTHSAGRWEPTIIWEQKRNTALRAGTVAVGGEGRAQMQGQEEMPRWLRGLTQQQRDWILTRERGCFPL